MSKPKSKYGWGKHPNTLANLAKSRGEGKGFKPGQSGNPKGRPPNIKYVSEALRERLASGDLDDVTLADLLADSLIKRAKKSDFALNIILERTEGKVTQPIGGEDGKPIEVLIDYRGKMLSAISRHVDRSGEREDIKETQP